MKKLLLLFLLATGGISCGMELPSTQNEESAEIFITEPTLNESSKLHEIQLFDGEISVGSITYFPQNKDQTTWKIYLFRVHRSYRNARLGTALFKTCVEDIKSKGGQVLAWEAMPVDTTINLDILITIYKKIIEKIDLKPEALSIGAPQGTGILRQAYMTLRLS